MARGKEGREGKGEAMERSGGEAIARRGGEAMSLFQRMVEEMDWMFDQMQRSLLGGPLMGWPGPRRGEGPLQRIPRLEVDDRQDELVLTAELPGLGPDEAHVECKDDMLIIRGERREGDEEGRSQSYTSFYRQVPLPPDVDVERGQASFKNGLLRVRFPKTEGEGQVRRIPISTEARGPSAQPEKSQERAA